MKTPAAVAGASLTISDRSGLPLALMPQCRPLARKPDGAVTPPAIDAEVRHERATAVRRPFDGGSTSVRRLARSSSRTIAYWPQLRNSGHELQSCAIFSGTQVCGTIEKPRRTKNAGSWANAHRRV